MRQTGKIQMKLIDTEAHKDELKEALGTGSFRLLMRAFFFPKMVRSFFIRFLIVAAVAWLFFKFICLPLIVAGGSMLPTYAERGFNFCWRPSYWFSEPERGDVVVMKYGSNKVMILKRLIAKEGDTVEFRNGKLILNGREQEEPYIKGPSDWNLPPRTVEKDHYYLVGDNRSVPMQRHIFGQMHKRYLQGAPLW